MLALGFDAEVDAYLPDADLYPVAVMQRWLAPHLINARRLARALTDAQSIMPAAWISVKQAVPQDVMDLIASALDQVKPDVDGGVLTPVP